ncbi:MAG: geranylgeranylglycerol-phosphate geranylgeranyltransferase [Saprospiraceae bacterium]|nr:geranylgeranylglycerol-phosphate geranylgeranyltransferase [Lewinella sp.]
MIIALARLIRLPNLIIVALTQYLLYYFVFLANFRVHDLKPVLDLTHFSLLVLVTVMLTAGGNVINDVLDLQADKINKPQKMVISRYISRRTALWIYFSLQATGFFIAVYLSFLTGNQRLLWLYPAASIGLYTYSSYFKRIPLAGHLLISVYCAGVALIIWVAEFPNYVALYRLESDRALMIRNVTLFYSGFAFISTLLRELIKVLEDEKGDRLAGYRTTAIVWGEMKVKGLGILMGIILILLLSISGIYFRPYFESLDLVIGLGVLMLPIILIIVGLSKITTSSNFKQLSRLTKLLMLMGILVLIFFR